MGFFGLWGLWGDSQTVLYICHPALIHRHSSTTTSDRKQWQRCEIINGVVAQPNTFPAQHILRRMADARKRANRRPRRMVPHLRRNWQLLRLRTITLNVNASLLLLQGTHSLRTPRRKGKDRGRQPHAPHGFTLWRAGRFGEQWERVKQDHGKRSAGQQKRDDHQLQREARRVAKLETCRPMSPVARPPNCVPAEQPPLAQKRCRRWRNFSQQAICPRRLRLRRSNV